MCMSKKYVRLTICPSLGHAQAVARMLHANGIDDVNIWPYNEPPSIVVVGHLYSHIVMVAQGSLREARRLLRQSGLLEPEL